MISSKLEALATACSRRQFHCCLMTQGKRPYHHMCTAQHLGQTPEKRRMEAGWGSGPLDCYRYLLEAGGAGVHQVAHDVGQVGAQIMAHAHCQGTCPVQAPAPPVAVRAGTAVVLVQGLARHMHLHRGARLAPQGQELLSGKTQAML